MHASGGSDGRMPCQMHVAWMCGMILDSQHVQLHARHELSNARWPFCVSRRFVLVHAAVTVTCRGVVCMILPWLVHVQICSDLHGCWSPRTPVAPYEPDGCLVLSSEAAGGSQYARAFIDVHTVLYVKKSLGSHA